MWISLLSWGGTLRDQEKAPEGYAGLEGMMGKGLRRELVLLTCPRPVYWWARLPPFQDGALSGVIEKRVLLRGILQSLRWCDYYSSFSLKGTV